MSSPWVERVESVQPTVLVIGGFLTSPPLYDRFVRRLLDRGVAAVVVAPIWLPDWLLLAVRGFGPLVTRSARALLRANALAAASPVSAGAPILVVGHSAGGLVGRLLTSPEPFEGRRLGASERIGALITLGTPHRVAHGRVIGHQVAVRAAAFADEHLPGAWFAPRVGYVAVGSRAIAADPEGDGRARVAHRLYAELVEESGPDHRVGDGLVPAWASMLEGATAVILDDAVHGHLAGRPWYGAEPVLDRWWPIALEAWRAALRARAESAGLGA